MSVIPYGFLPFLLTTSSFTEPETGNTVTLFGQSLGLVASDVNGNVSHNIFTATGGMTPVDLRNGDSAQPLTLAFRGQVDAGGAVPEPRAVLLLALVAGATLWRQMRSPGRKSSV